MSLVHTVELLYRIFKIYLDVFFFYVPYTRHTVTAAITLWNYVLCCIAKENKPFPSFVYRYQRSPIDTWPGGTETIMISNRSNYVEIYRDVYHGKGFEPSPCKLDLLPIFKFVETPMNITRIVDNREYDKEKSKFYVAAFCNLSNTIWINNWTFDDKFYLETKSFIIKHYAVRILPTFV